MRRSPSRSVAVGVAGPGSLNRRPSNLNAVELPTDAVSTALNRNLSKIPTPASGVGPAAATRNVSNVSLAVTVKLLLIVPLVMISRNLATPELYKTRNS